MEFRTDILPLDCLNNCETFETFNNSFFFTKSSLFSRTLSKTIQSICPIGSTAIIDVDKGQITDNYNRIIAVVYCNNRNLNAELIINGHATIDEEFCNVSEFANEDWAKKYGC